jgi:PST family polysaccharide transporter
VNSTVIIIRLIIALFIQRILAVAVGEAGIAKIGQLRNVMAMLTSVTTLGVGNGVIKYLSEHKAEQHTLNKLFSGTFILGAFGSVFSAIVLLFFADGISLYLFDNSSYRLVVQVVGLAVPFIAMHRIFNSVISGLSDYKSYAKIDLFAYILATVLLLGGLYWKNITGVLVAIALAPLIQWVMLMIIFGKTLRQYIRFRELKWDTSYLKPLLGFTLMSFVSTFLINTVELDIRTQIANRISIDEAGYWTALTFISKNYMVFISGVLALYVLPKFAKLKTKTEFIKEIIYVFRSILPLFAIGMVGIYLFRDTIIDLIYPKFTGMSPLFKWQLIGDFIKLISMILAYQFLAKKLVKTFIITELISLTSFYLFSMYFIQFYETEGVVIAHFVRYVIYLFAVLIGLGYYFKNRSPKTS